MKQLRIVTVVCAFSLSMAQVNAEDQFLVNEGKAANSEAANRPNIIFILSDDKY